MHIISYVSYDHIIYHTVHFTHTQRTPYKASTYHTNRT